MQSVVFHHTALMRFADGLRCTLGLAACLGRWAAQIQIVFEKDCFFPALYDGNDNANDQGHTKQKQNEVHRNLHADQGNGDRRNQRLAAALGPLGWAFLRAGRAQLIGELVQHNKTTDCEYQVYLFHGQEVGIAPSNFKMGRV